MSSLLLRRPTSEVLAKFHAGGTRLVLWWWAFTLTAVAMAPLAVLTALALDDVGDSSASRSQPRGSSPR